MIENALIKSPCMPKKCRLIYEIKSLWLLFVNCLTGKAVRTF